MLRRARDDQIENIHHHNGNAITQIHRPHLPSLPALPPGSASGAHGPPGREANAFERALHGAKMFFKGPGSPDVLDMVVADSGWVTSAKKVIESMAAKTDAVSEELEKLHAGDKDFAEKITADGKTGKHKINFELKQFYGDPSKYSQSDLEWAYIRPGASDLSRCSGELRTPRCLCVYLSWLDLLDSDRADLVFARLSALHVFPERKTPGPKPNVPYYIARCNPTVAVWPESESGFPFVILIDTAGTTEETLTAAALNASVDKLSQLAALDGRLYAVVRVDSSKGPGDVGLHDALVFSFECMNRCRPLDK